MSHLEDEDDGVPVLNEVVESGNESIIQSSRLGREVLRELEVLQQEPVKFVLPAHILDTVQDHDVDEANDETHAHDNTSVFDASNAVDVDLTQESEFNFDSHITLDAEGNLDFDSHKQPDADWDVDSERVEIELSSESGSQERQLDLMIDDLPAFNVASNHSDDELELMIDEVVDRHITELRKDIKSLLLRVMQNNT